jgi:hypothetical protein
VAAPPLDELVGWETDRRGRVTALRGARRRYRIGWLGRFLLPGLDADLAGPGDLLAVLTPPLSGAPVTALASISRGTTATVPLSRRLIVAVGLLVPLWWSAHRLFPEDASGWALVAAMLIASVFPVMMRVHHDRALAFAAPQAADSANLYWTLARRRLAPDAPPLKDPEPGPEPDWTERLAQSFAGTLEDHEWVKAGMLPVPDGRLVVSDPFDIERAAARATEIPAGTYPVTLAIGRFGPPKSRFAEWRVAHAWVRLTQGPVAEWAVPAEEERRAAWVSVDSALAAFVSASAVPALVAAYGEGEERWLDPRLTEALQRQMASTASMGGRHWAVIRAGDARMIAFESGHGDGSYPVVRGLGADGELVAVAIDFRVANWIYAAP